MASISGSNKVRTLENNTPTQAQPTAKTGNILSLPTEILALCLAGDKSYALVCRKFREADDLLKAKLYIKIGNIPFTTDFKRLLKLQNGSSSEEKQNTPQKSLKPYSEVPKDWLMRLRNTYAFPHWGGKNGDGIWDGREVHIYSRSWFVIALAWEKIKARHNKYPVLNQLIKEMEAREKKLLKKKIEKL